MSLTVAAAGWTKRSGQRLRHNASSPADLPIRRGTVWMSTEALRHRRRAPHGRAHLREPGQSPSHGATAAAAVETVQRRSSSRRCLEPPPAAAGGRRRGCGWTLRVASQLTRSAAIYSTYWLCRKLLALAIGTFKTKLVGGRTPSSFPFPLSLHSPSSFRPLPLPLM